MTGLNGIRVVKVLEPVLSGMCRFNAVENLGDTPYRDQ